MNSWDAAADTFEDLLDGCDRLAGGVDSDLPELVEFALTGAPDPGTMQRLQELLARTSLTQAMVRERMADTDEQLRQLQRTREVGYRYLAF